MRISVILAFFLLLNSGICVSQESSYIFKYNVKLSKKELSSKSFSFSRAWLFYSDTVTYFVGEKVIQKREMFKSKEYINAGIEEKKNMYMGLSTDPLRFHIVKNHKRDKLRYYMEFNGAKQGYEEDLPMMDWQIIPEEKSILGYSCQKAKTHFAGRDYIAWFSPDIPFSDGPYKFHGLPGLIFSIEDTEGKIEFVLEEIEKNSEIKRPTSSSKNLFTRKEFEKRMDDFYMNQKLYVGDKLSRVSSFTISGREASIDEFYEVMRKEHLERLIIEKQ